MEPTCKTCRGCGLTLPLDRFSRDISSGTHRACPDGLRARCKKCNNRYTRKWCKGKGLYDIWHGMRARCENPNSPIYHYYGGRGISICPRWRSYEQFASDMGPRPSRRHSIDRIDNNGDYSPENCRWATPSEQSRNQRDTQTITVANETLPVVAWAERVGVPYHALWQRLKRGWSPERAVSVPLKKRPAT